MNSGLKYLILLTILTLMASCRAKHDNPGTEYAPNMYHSVAYEPLKQIKDKDAGNWVNSDDDPYGEYYSSNPNNPFEMNMREPEGHPVMPDFELLDLDGKSVRLSQFKGETVLLGFFTTW